MTGTTSIKPAKNSSSRWLFFLIPLIYLLVVSNIKWGGQQWRSMVITDAKGYYDYFPALFIYQDLSFAFFDTFKQTDYYTETKFQDYRQTVVGGTINKYTAGVALAQLPFTLGAHLMAPILGAPQDGYSKPYLIAVSIAAVFYATLGLWCLLLILAEWGIERRWQYWVAGLLAFGTHLFVYALPEPGMSHVYSFAFMSLFYWSVLRLSNSQKTIYLLGSGLAFGMILLLRPINVLAIFAVPFLLGSWEQLSQLWKRVWQKPFWLVFCLMAGLSVPFLQAIIYYQQTGYWWHYSYPGEGFDFTQPKLWKILFSYRKGLFLYTPILLVSLWGLAYMSRFRRWSGILFLCLLTYVFSSWGNWWYGGSFSSRPYVEYLPFFGISLGVLLQKSKGVLRTSLLAILVVLGLICQVQIYQYRYYQIHYSDMTKERYWDVFLRLDQLIK